MTVPRSTQPQPAGRGRLLRYARWQLTDYLRERGISTLVLGAVVLLVPVLVGGDAVDAIAPTFLADNVGRLGILAALFALNGISSIDRQRGYFRFLFAKPVGVPRFYAQDFAVRLIGVLGVAALLLAVFTARTGIAFPLWAIGHIAVTFVLVGGVGFLLSAITHRDGVALVAVYVATALLRGGVDALGWFGMGPAGVLRPVVHALPPFHLLDPLRDALATGTPVGAGDLLWVLAYGLGAFAAGLVVLRHRPLST